jgi:hypothetical protein
MTAIVPRPDPAAADDEFNVWDLLEKSLPKTQSTSPTKEHVTDEPKKTALWERLKLSLLLRLCDGLGLIFWSYAVLKIFVFDVDRVLIDAVLPSASWILGYRLLGFVAIISAVSILLWRWITAFVIAYVVFFPLIVLVWKIPAFLLRHRSWMVVMVTINSLSLFLRDLRYNLISKGLALLAAFVILVTSSDILLILAAIYLSGLLCLSTCRVIHRTFESNWFLTIQKKAIDRIVGSSPVKWVTTLDREKLPPRDSALTELQLNDVLFRIQMGVAVNRSLYFWAHKLDQYRQSRLSLLFNISAYVWQFLGAAVVFTLLNIALLKIDGSQYEYSNYPSELAIAVYTVSNFVLSDGGGVSAAKDPAYLLRLAAGLYGVIFLAILLFNSIFTFVRERDDAALKQTVNDLRSRAREQDKDFENEMRVSVDEAIRRIEALGKGGLLFFLKWLTPPASFIDDSS